MLNYRKKGRECVYVSASVPSRSMFPSLLQHKWWRFMPQLTSIRTKLNPCPHKPPSFMSTAIYLTQRDCLVITLAELVLLKILKSSTVIYRTEMCLEWIQHYSSILKTWPSRWRQRERLNTGDIGCQDFTLTAARERQLNKWLTIWKIEPLIKKIPNGSSCKDNLPQFFLACSVANSLGSFTVQRRVSWAD